MIKTNETKCKCGETIDVKRISRIQHLKSFSCEYLERVKRDRTRYLELKQSADKTQTRLKNFINKDQNNIGSNPDVILFTWDEVDEL